VVGEVLGDALRVMRGGSLKGFSTLKLFHNFSGGQIRLKFHFISMLRDNPLNEPSNSVLIVFIQPNPHLELFKFLNVIFHLEIFLAMRNNLEVEFLLV